MQLQVGGSYKNVTVLNAETCGALIRHFAFNSSEVAQYSLEKFTAAGINQWIQGITGWQPQPKTPNLFEVILDEPRPWELHFDPEWRAQAMRLTELDWRWARMGKFIKASVYDYLPDDVMERLERVNPITESGYRANKHHQHFGESADEKALKTHIANVKLLMQSSATLSEFKRLMAAKYEGVYQLQVWEG